MPRTRVRETAVFTPRSTTSEKPPFPIRKIRNSNTSRRRVATRRSVSNSSPPLRESSPVSTYSPVDGGLPSNGELHSLSLSLLRARRINRASRQTSRARAREYRVQTIAARPNARRADSCARAQSNTVNRLVDTRLIQRGPLSLSPTHVTARGRLPSSGETQPPCESSAGFATPSAPRFRRKHARLLLIRKQRLIRPERTLRFGTRRNSRFYAVVANSTLLSQFSALIRCVLDNGQRKGPFVICGKRVICDTCPAGMVHQTGTLRAHGCEYAGYAGTGSLLHLFSEILISLGYNYHICIRSFCEISPPSPQASPSPSNQAASELTPHTQLAGGRLQVEYPRPPK